MKSKIKIIAISILFFANSVYAFTYQGELSFSGAPYNGNADFRFTLFDDVSAGSNLGPNDQQNSVAVSNGRFAVDLDLWVAQFDGGELWLEIAVSAPAGGGLVVLSPRQKLGPTPYAEYAYDGAGTGAITSVFGGTGLTGGGTSGNITLSVDTTSIQRRVTGSCSAGTVFNGVNSDGSAVCDLDTGGDLTGVSALTGGGISVATAAGPVPVLSIRVDGVTSSHINGNEIPMNGDVVRRLPAGGPEIFLFSALDAISGENARCMVTASAIFHRLEQGDTDGINANIAIRRTDDSTGLFAENPAGAFSTIFSRQSFNSGVSLGGSTNRAVSTQTINVFDTFRYQFGCHLDGVAAGLQDDELECTVSWICL